MAKIKTDIDDLHQHSHEDSSETEYISLNQNDVSYDNPMTTYKLVSVPEDDPGPNMQDSPVHDTTYFVISNPVEVFSAPTAPKKPMRTITLNTKTKTLTKKRDDKRRATHNEVERRRRDKINNWIMKLADLVPNARMPDSASKGGILAKACDHITELTERQKRLEKLELENESLIQEVFRLNQELDEYRQNTNITSPAGKASVFMRHKVQKS